MEEITLQKRYFQYLNSYIEKFPKDIGNEIILYGEPYKRYMIDKVLEIKDDYDILQKNEYLEKIKKNNIIFNVLEKLNEEFECNLQIFQIEYKIDLDFYDCYHTIYIKINDNIDIPDNLYRCFVIDNNDNFYGKAKKYVKQNLYTFSYDSIVSNCEYSFGISLKLFEKLHQNFNEEELNILLKELISSRIELDDFFDNLTDDYIQENGSSFLNYSESDIYYLHLNLNDIDDTSFVLHYYDENDFDEL